MYHMKFRNCNVCISPLLAFVEIILIFILVKATPYILRLNLNFLDHVIISCLILIFILFSLLAHEYAHLLAAQWMHLPVKKITVSLFGAVTSMDEEPSSPKESFLLYLAGPLINIILGIAFYASCLSFEGNGIFAAVCFFVATFNGIFSAYNLLPVIPLDGGFILRSVLWKMSGDWLWSTRISCYIGTSLPFIFLLTGLIHMIVHKPIICIAFLVAGLSLVHNSKTACHQVYAAKILGLIKRSNEHEIP